MGFVNLDGRGIQWALSGLASVEKIILHWPNALKIRHPPPPRSVLYMILLRGFCINVKTRIDLHLL
jgi:hypothetical protein